MWRSLAVWPSRLAGTCREGLANRARYARCFAKSFGLRQFNLALASPPPRQARAIGGGCRHGTLVAVRATHSKTTEVEQEHAEYWRSVLSRVDKPTAAKLLVHVNPEFLLGLPPSDPAGVGQGRKGRRKTPPVLHYFSTIKRQHPTKVALVRVGEFFETVGIDAVLMVQYAGLNPMGAGDPPRAGCPRANLRRTVADLMHAGLSVVVCEEAAEPYSYGYRRTNTKERYVAQVLTPATPHLLYGLIDEDADVALDSAPPLLGISMQVGGFTVVEVNVELFKVTVTQGLTEDAVYARLFEGGLSPPLFIHTPGGVGGREVPALEPWERRVAQAFRSQAGSVERYTGADPVLGLIARVRQALDIPPNAHFTVVSSSSTDQPRPLYCSTAANLGLHSSRGVPPLLDSLLPPSAPSASRAWLRQLLLFPPPPRIGAAILAACTQLKDLQAPVPMFPAMGVTNVVLKLTQREANDIFFRELAALCTSVEEACTAPELAGLAGPLAAVAAHSTGLSFPPEDLAAACRAARLKIDEVVDPQERIAGGGSTDEAEEAVEARDPTGGALWRFQQANENKFRLRVQNSCIRNEHDAVENAWRQVEAAARSMMGQVAGALAQGNLSGPATAARSSPVLAFNSVNNAVWVRVPRAAGAAQAMKQLGFTHPNDRLGIAELGYYSTHELEVAQDGYRRACGEACEAVKARLKELSAELQALLPPLVGACIFATAASALTAHMHEAARRGWTLPTQLYPPDFLPGAAEAEAGAGPLEVHGMWPYWLDGRSPEVVRNDCSMQGMFLLTGPNMAGKSTLLRTLCAVSLLGACGLSVPARGASVPYLDAFMLRNFSADSPVDGRSSFAVEMTEMRYVLSDVTARSLVLVDELGKGTEVRAGAALAGAMLEELARIRAKGIFATHLHVLLDMQLTLPGVQLMQMEVVREQRRQQQQQLHAGGAEPEWELKPTWRMRPGASRESLALEVARDNGVPPAVIHRAAELYAGMHAAAYTSPAAAEPAGVAGQMGAGLHGSEEGSASAVQPPRAGLDAEGAAGDPWPTGQGSPSSWRSIEAAGELLLATTAHIVDELLQQQQQPIGGGAAGDGMALQQEAAEQGQQGTAGAELAPTDPAPAAAAAEGAALTVQYVRPGREPPPRTVGCACVYVLRREDGAFYVGQTDSLKQRIATHRRRKPSRSSRVGGGPGIEVAYVALQGAQGAASTARVAEMAVIKALEQKGFPLLSNTDAQRKHAPRFA